MLGTRCQSMTVFSEENIDLNKCEKVGFLEISHFLTAKMRKASSESWTKEGAYCTIKMLSCNK